jgi:hypothetical protein
MAVQGETRMLWLMGPHESGCLPGSSLIASGLAQAALSRSAANWAGSLRSRQHDILRI